MAISRDEAAYRFEQQCRAMWEEARLRGDHRLADEIYQHFEQRKYEMSTGQYDPYNNGGLMGSALGLGQQGAMNNAMNSAIANQYTSALQNAFVTQPAPTPPAPPKTDFSPEYGTLYLNNKELPADWCGAKITEYKRSISVTGHRWVIVFLSKWDKALEIRLYLDVEELNGKEVNATAETYMEALNQRRAG